MNPLNSQTQFILTGMPPLAPVSANSNLKTSAAPPSMTTLNTNHPSGVMTSSHQTTNHLLDANNFITNTSYLPVLLTNQTIITNVEQQQSQIQKMPPTLINVTNSPVVTAANMTTFMSSGKQQPMVMTTNPSAGNITYQVLTSPQNATLGSAVLATQNGAVSVLLTTTSSPTMAATSGHVAAPPSFIIRNTPTALAAPNIPSAASTQIKQPIQHQYQHQFQQQLLSQSLDTEHWNPEILKQIDVGNSNSTSNSTPGKTMLKPTILRNKPQLASIRKQQSTDIVNKTENISAQQLQQQKLKGPQAISGKSDNVSTAGIDSIGPEILTTYSQSANNNNNNNGLTQTAQKLSQVSLLQNPKTKPLLNTTTANICTNAATTTSIGNVQNNKKPNVLKKKSKIRVGNLNSEVSLIQKSTSNGEKLKEQSPSTSLLKSTSTLEKQPQEIFFLKTTKLVPNSSGTNNASDNKSILKSISNDKPNFIENLTSVSTKTNNEVLENNYSEKQESLLKTNKKNATTAAEKNSVRYKRSVSCNSGLQSPQTSEDASNLDGNGRRYSEPNKFETTDQKSITKSQHQETSNAAKSSNAKEFRKFEKVEVRSFSSHELDTLIEGFEDEEYLESSGEKLTTASTNTCSELSIKSTKSQEQTQNEEHINSLQLKQKCVQVHGKVDDDKNETSQKITLGHKGQSKNNTDFESDDDVTILPSSDEAATSIEIDDDEEEEQKQTAISSRENDLLLCEEEVLISSHSSVSIQSPGHISSSSSLLIQKPSKTSQSTTTAHPLNKKSVEREEISRKRKLSPTLVKEEPIKPINIHYLSVICNYDMLNWRERTGTARGTKLKFQLNEFNLIQVHEKVPNRTKCLYEKPVHERDNFHTSTAANEVIVYYMCRRCNVRASAMDFLAPEFCSLYCLRRDRRKRQQREDENPCILRRKQRNLLLSSNINHKNDTNPPPLAYLTQQPKFRWPSYLKANLTSIAPPVSLFLNPFPTGPNNFRVGMKLEAIDPENCSLFCVCTVVAINGYRLKLRFDGYDSSYDFWLNADSMDIFPPGWCSKTKRILQPPKGISANKFNWGLYLSRERATPAPRHFFSHLNSSSLLSRNQFKIGMHLEAEDLNDTGKLCVASVADVLDDRIRIHFDGWDDCYDIIAGIKSPYIHPCGWHASRQQLVVPPECENTTFIWDDYIRKQGTGVAASKEFFVPREPINFKPNMKLEVVDPRNSSLIRPATVVCHKGHRVKLHLDGWPNGYCFWLEDDSPDLHPIGWCDATGHDLEPPPGFKMTKQKMLCPINGCRGIGNTKMSFMSVHSTRDCCPYASENWRIVMEKTPRVDYDDITRTLPSQCKQMTLQQQQNHHGRLSGQDILERLEILDNIKTRNMLMKKDKFGASPKDLILLSALSKFKEEHNKVDDQTLSTSSEPCKVKEDGTAEVKIAIAKEYLCDYGPRLHQNYTLWQINSPFDVENIEQNPLSWLVSDVVAFVEQTLKITEICNIFAQEDIDGEAFLLLQQRDLTERLGLKLGPAVKLYSSILQLRMLAVTKFNVGYHNVSKN